ncbi:MAG: endo-1,4-beta-xylanase [Armatimonadetes bacterium]|nr:endo-1,4-beta-xylanase [Armatimonadota bacterium]
MSDTPGQLDGTAPSDGAARRIRAHRMGDLTVTVTDVAGRPAAGRRVRVRQRSHAFLFGCNGFGLAGGDQDALARAYREQFAALFNFATTPFYWSGYEPAAGLTQQARLEAMGHWCAERGIEVKGHPLVWTHPAGVPAWLPEDPDVVRALSEGRIAALAAHFRGLIDRWDVVNEPTDPFRFSNALAAQLKHHGLIPCLRQAYRQARMANPTAQLVINDYRLDADFERIIEQLVDDVGEPLYDAIGLQTHQHGGILPPERLWAVCESFARFGMPLHFTENTLLSGRRAKPGPVDFESRESQFLPTNPDDEAEQARATEAFYTTLFSHPAVEAITWWDFSDRDAWLGAPAGLIRADGSPKPAYETLLRLIRHDWWTDEEAVTDAHGQVQFRVYAGQLEVSAGGASAVASVMRRGSGAVGLRVG